MSRGNSGSSTSSLGDSEPRRSALIGGCRGVLVGIGLAVAAYSIGIDSGRAVIKFAYATVAGLAVGEVVTFTYHTPTREATEQAQSRAVFDAIGITIGLALAIGPYTLESSLFSMYQATIAATLVGLSLLLGTGWRLAREGNSSQGWNAVRLAIAGAVVMILAIFILQ